MDVDRIIPREDKIGHIRQWTRFECPGVIRLLPPVPAVVANGSRDVGLYKLASSKGTRAGRDQRHIPGNLPDLPAKVEHSNCVLVIRVSDQRVMMEFYRNSVVCSLFLFADTFIATSAF